MIRTFDAFYFFDAFDSFDSFDSFDPLGPFGSPGTLDTLDTLTTVSARRHAAVSPLMFLAVSLAILPAVSLAILLAVCLAILLAVSLTILLAVSLTILLAVSLTILLAHVGGCALSQSDTWHQADKGERRDSCSDGLFLPHGISPNIGHLSPALGVRPVTTIAVYVGFIPTSSICGKYSHVSYNSAMRRFNGS